MPKNKHKQRRNRIAQQIDAIRIVLWEHWNPIGFPVPADEYDSYIPSVLRLLQAGADVYRLTEHLQSLEINITGTQGERNRNARVAEELMALRINEMHDGRL